MSVSISTLLEVRVVWKATEAPRAHRLPALLIAAMHLWAVSMVDPAASSGTAISCLISSFLLGKCFLQRALLWPLDYPHCPGVAFWTPLILIVNYPVVSSAATQGVLVATTKTGRGTMQAHNVSIALIRDGSSSGRRAVIEERGHSSADSGMSR